MRKHALYAGWLAILICALLALLIQPNAQADEPVIRDAAVLQRQDTMKTAKAALSILSDMSAMRLRFDRKQARAAKQQLKTALRDIPHRFERPFMDPHTKARREIWQNWSDFTRNAQTAHRAARAIRTNTLPALRRTIPAMVAACINCHRHYRQD